MSTIVTVRNTVVETQIRPKISNRWKPSKQAPKILKYQTECPTDADHANQFRKHRVGDVEQVARIGSAEYRQQRQYCARSHRIRQPGVHQFVQLILLARGRNTGPRTLRLPSGAQWSISQ